VSEVDLSFASPEPDGDEPLPENLLERDGR
jgi:hypothetical protein